MLIHDTRLPSFLSQRVMEEALDNKRKIEKKKKKLKINVIIIEYIEYSKNIEI